MGIELGNVAPDFMAQTTAGRIEFHRWLGHSWGLLFAHPKDFTPVCTTELGEVARLKPEFDRRDVKVIGLSVDSVGDHQRWAGDIEETQGAALNYPLVGDPERKIARQYRMIHPDSDPGVTVRSVFVIGPDKRVKATLTYPPSTGRNFLEILRVIDFLQITAKHGVAILVNWRPGQGVIISPSVADAEAKRRYPSWWKELKSYLSTAPSLQSDLYRFGPDSLTPARADVVFRKI